MAELEAENQRMRAVMANLGVSPNAASSFDATRPKKEVLKGPPMSRTERGSMTETTPILVKKKPMAPAVRSHVIPQRGRVGFKQLSVVPQYTSEYQQQVVQKRELKKRRGRSGQTHNANYSVDMESAERLIEELSLRSNMISKMSKQIKDIKRQQMSPITIWLPIVICVLALLLVLAILIKAT